MDIIVLRAKIANDDDFAITCMLKLFDRQTESEQDAAAVLEQNGRGFNKADAAVLTKYVEFYHDWSRLTAVQLTDLHKRLPKYAKQLSGILTEAELE